MNKALRPAVIAGNWKMNNTPAQTAALLAEMKPLVAGAACEVVVCVPFVDIAAARDALAGSNVRLGAQNVHFEPSGAYTGEVSAEMLTACGVTHVIIGHSERRAYFGETDETVNRRAKAALAAGLTAIICVGERLCEREQGITSELVALQTKIALLDIPIQAPSNVIIAYEPVWAIGTGKTATNEQAEEVCATIRAVLAEIYSKDVAEQIRIQYGGSVTADNAAGLFAQPNIDGGLVGGASLKLDFEKIVNY